MSKEDVNRIDVITKQILDHPLNRFQKDWDTLFETHNEMMVAGLYLQEGLQKIEVDADFAVSVLSDNRIVSERAAYYKYLSRNLKMFCSNLATLIDQTRKIFRKTYSDTPFYDEWSSKIVSLTNNPSIIFMKDLRNFLDHVANPPWRIILSSVSTNINGKVFLNTKDLQEGDSWTSLSKKILKEQPEEVYLLPLVADYLIEIEKLWKWGFAQYSVLHEKEIEEVALLKKELALLMSQGKIDSLEEAELQFKKDFLKTIELTDE